MDSRIEYPSLIEGMDFGTYLADPADTPSLTSSLIRHLLSTAPAAVWQHTPRLNAEAVPNHRTAFDLGTAAHAEFVGGGEPLVVIDADSWRTKDARESRAEAYSQGKTPILAKDMKRVEGMKEAANSFFGSHHEIGEIVRHKSLFRESSIFWKEIGVPCRCRPDLYLHVEKWVPIIIHYKTTGHTIVEHDLERFAAVQGWDLIAAHYEAGVKALTGLIPLQYFAIQETTKPYLGIVVDLHESFVQSAQFRREQAVKIWAECLRNDHWPGHIKESITLRVPMWHETNMTAQRDRDSERGYKVDFIEQEVESLQNSIRSRILSGGDD